MSTPCSYLRIAAIGIVCMVALHLAPQEAIAQDGRSNGSAASVRFASLRDGQARAAALHRDVALDLRGVSLQAALEEIARQAGLSLVMHSRFVLPAHEVTVGAGSIAAGAALVRALDGTDLDLLVSPNGDAVLVERPQPEPISGMVSQVKTPIGTISGRVTDSLTGAAVSGATVTLEGASFGAVTGNTGRFRIANVPAGEYTVVVSQLAYAEARRSLTLADDQEATVDFALDVAAVPLDQVVVTGTAFETQVRTVPNPITVITSRDIEAKGATSIAEVLRGEVPGVMPLSAGGEDLYSQIYVRGNAGSAGGDWIKVYVDGVEVAHPTQLGTIDPKSIERIEVIRGPQASVIYGSGAASGVLQIFTKKGSPGVGGPRLDAQVSAGIVQGDYTPPSGGTPLTQDYAFGVSGGADAFSYRVGANYATVGEWLKNYKSDRTNVSGGLKASQGPFTLGLTARWSERSVRYPQRPAFLDFPTNPQCPQCGNPDYRDSGDTVVGQHTVGVTVDYAPTSRWQHTLTVGQDQNHYFYDQSEPSLNTPADTLLVLRTREFRRRSIKYHTAYDADLGSAVTARITAGVDYWRYILQGNSATNLRNAFGNVDMTPLSQVTVFNTGWSNTGYFGMAELGFAEQLYLTLAARVEDHSLYGSEYGHAVSPRVGASYVHQVGPAEVKFRAQYGIGVRPPPPEAAAGVLYSASLEYLPNPEIAPEEKIGWDAGVEAFWGDRASVSVTRYEEEARNLIEQVTIDPAAQPPVYQFRNIGVVKMDGWELDGRLNLGAVSLRANYAYADSEILQVTEETAANPDATLKVGDRTTSAPKHAGGGAITFRLTPETSVGVDASVMAGARQLDYVAYYGYLYAGEPFRGSTRDYYVALPAVWKWNLHADRVVTDRITTFVRVTNLGNEQRTDTGNYTVARGRTTELGIRITL